jgi:hypothetical protein
VDPGYLSEPRAIEFPTAGDRKAYMNYYPPKNKVHSCCMSRAKVWLQQDVVVVGMELRGAECLMLGGSRK